MLSSRRSGCFIYTHTAIRRAPAETSARRHRLVGQGRRRVMFPWSGNPEDRMFSEIEDEFAVYRRRCEILHDEFRQKLRKRDEARSALAEAEERIMAVQMEGVALLGNLNTAMSGGDKESIKELGRGYKKNNRDLIRAQKTRDTAVRKLETVEVDDERVVADLKKSVSEVLDEYAERVWNRKQWLTGLVETLDGKQRTLAQDAAPLTGEYQPWQPPEELPAAENPRED